MKARIFPHWDNCHQKDIFEIMHHKMKCHAINIINAKLKLFCQLSCLIF